MAKSDTQFKKGQSGNPGGRPKEPEAMKVIRRLTQEQLAEIVEAVLLGKTEEMAALAYNADTHLKAHIAKAIHTEFKKGGFATLEAVLNRVLGKPKEHHQLTGMDGEELRFADTEAAAKLAAIFEAVKARKEK